VLENKVISVSIPLIEQAGRERKRLNDRDTPINGIICILEAKTTRYRGWLA
jgi:hypothetical protein